MSAAYVIKALPAESFTGFFQMDEPELARAGARLIVVDESPGYPCRVSLQDAAVGETVLAVSYAHLPEAGPYRSCGPIFVRKGATTTRPGVGEVPAMLVSRLLSVRAYGADHQMALAEVIEGVELGSWLGSWLAEASVAYVDIHNARPGCFNCRAVRA